MIVVPFKAEHLELIELQGAQAYLSGWVSRRQGRALEKKPSFSALVGETPIAVAGIIPQWPGRAVAWAFLSDTGPKYFLGVHRAVQGFLDGCDTPRIEMTVGCEFPEAHRWARMLGFTMEAGYMKGYAPDGSDCALYARVLT